MVTNSCHVGCAGHSWAGRADPSSKGSQAASAAVTGTPLKTTAHLAQLI